MQKMIPTFLSGLTRQWGAALLLVAAVSLILSTPAAASANGKYKYQSAKGSFEILGQSVKIGRQDLKGVVAKKRGYAVIKNNKLLLNPKGGTKLVDKAFSGPNFNVKVTATGPKSINLKKKGKAYVGKATSPIVVKVQGTASGQPVNANFEYQFNANVKGSNLVLTIPISGFSSGFAVTGKIKVLCKR